MEYSRGEVVAGAVTLAVAAGFLVYALQGTSLATPSGAYPLTASFRSADGISPGSDVRLAGVKVGAVTSLDLNRDTFRADVTVSLDEGVNIPDDSSIAISSEGLLGGNFVEIVPGGSPFNLAAGDEFTDTQGALSLLGLLAKFVAASTSE